MSNPKSHAQACADFAVAAQKCADAAKQLAEALAVKALKEAAVEIGEAALGRKAAKRGR